MFRYGIITGRCSYNPAVDLRGVLKAPKFENYKALTASELPEFLRKLDAYDGHIQTKLARAAYNKAEYLPERRQMMQHWVDYLDSLSDGNVTPIRRGNSQ